MYTLRSQGPQGHFKCLLLRSTAMSSAYQLKRLQTFFTSTSQTLPLAIFEMPTRERCAGVPYVYLELTLSKVYYMKVTRSNLHLLCVCDLASQGKIGREFSQLRQDLTSTYPTKTRSIKNIQLITKARSKEQRFVKQ